MNFEDVFADDKARLDSALANNPLEQNHLRRCMELVYSLEWETGNQANELGRLLGESGVRQFDAIIERITETFSHLSGPNLQAPRQMLICAMFVHDLGKYDGILNRFNGTNHEVRSAQIVRQRRSALRNNLEWSDESIEQLVGLAHFHSILGILHLGGASTVYLEPLLEWLLPFDKMHQRYFLDLLIVLNCCDAAASGNFETHQFYLNHERLTTYTKAADTLLEAGQTLGSSTALASRAPLLAKAIQMPSMVERIQRIVSANNRLLVSETVAESALCEVIEDGHLVPTHFALTRFDHGTYVFEPMLHQLCLGAERVPQQILHNVLVLIGTMCPAGESPTVILLRDSFSMKPDFQPQNQHRFDELVDAVATGHTKSMNEILERYQADLYRSYDEIIGLQ